jgi:competence protein ComEA
MIVEDGHTCLALFVLSLPPNARDCSRRFLRVEASICVFGTQKRRYGTLQTSFFTALRLVLHMQFVRCCRSQAWLVSFILVLGSSSVNALDLNQATRAQLRAIKGVGNKLADRILAAREQGRFVSMEDLAARVAGVGPKKLQKLREQGVRTGSLAGRSVHQPASARSPGNKHFRPDRDKSTPVRRNVTASNKPANDLKHADDGLARRPIPAMPMLIRPRPRAGSAPSGLEKEPASTAARGKTH